jgi:hypothetical protein
MKSIKVIDNEHNISNYKEKQEFQKIYIFHIAP